MAAGVGEATVRPAARAELISLWQSARTSQQSARTLLCALASRVAHRGQHARLRDSRTPRTPAWGDGGVGRAGAGAAGRIIGGDEDIVQRVGAQRKRTEEWNM